MRAVGIARPQKAVAGPLDGEELAGRSDARLLITASGQGGQRLSLDRRSLISSDRWFGEM
jgi:hypothetical protein